LGVTQSGAGAAVTIIIAAKVGAFWRAEFGSQFLHFRARRIFLRRDSRTHGMGKDKGKGYKVSVHGSGSND
jgi:hypothetical protein